MCVALKCQPKRAIDCKRKSRTKCMVPTIPALGRWSPEDQKFEASFKYLDSSDLSWATNDPAFKGKKKKLLKKWFSR